MFSKLFWVRIWSELKNQKSLAVIVIFKTYTMVYHSHADPIWPDGTFKNSGKNNEHSRLQAVGGAGRPLAASSLSAPCRAGWPGA